MSGPRWADELHSDGEDSPAEPARLFYANVDEFVRSYLLPNWRRNTLHTSWCAKWWEHAEAITRLNAGRFLLQVLESDSSDLHIGN